MPALTVAAFNDFFNTTRSNILTGKDYIQFLRQRRSYPLFDMMAGQDPSNIAQMGGTEFLDTLDDANYEVDGEYNPGDFVQPDITSGTVQIRVPHSFVRQYVGWTQAEVDLNTANGSAAVKNFAKKKDHEGTRKIVTALDRILFRRPDSTRMEAAVLTGNTAREAVCLSAWISEDPFRFLPPSTALDTDSVWNSTTLANLNPQTVRGHRNQIDTYNANTLGDAFDGIVAANDRMHKRLGFMPVPESGGAMEADNGSDIVIYSNLLGVTLLSQLARAGNDSWVQSDDPKRKASTIYGHPVVWAEDLDTVPLDQTIGTAASPNAGQYLGRPYVLPRYFWVNKRYLRPKFLNGNVYSRGEPGRNAANQPDTYVVYYNSTVNIACSNRARQGIVAPRQ